MFSDGTKRMAQVDQGGTVQVQGCYGCPAGRGATLDEQEIGGPRKVTRPTLVPGVE
jgi:hypothetical protein